MNLNMEGIFQEFWPLPWKTEIQEISRLGQIRPKGRIYNRHHSLTKTIRAKIIQWFYWVFWGKWTQTRIKGKEMRRLKKFILYSNPLILNRKIDESDCNSCLIMCNASIFIQDASFSSFSCMYYFVN